MEGPYACPRREKCPALRRRADELQSVLRVEVVRVDLQGGAEILDGAKDIPQPVQRPPAPEKRFLCLVGAIEGGVGQGDEAVVTRGVEVGDVGAELIAGEAPRQSDRERLVVGFGRLPGALDI